MTAHIRRFLPDNEDAGRSDPSQSLGKTSPKEEVFISYAWSPPAREGETGIPSGYEEPVDAVLFGREAGEPATPRTAWDDVDDYDGLSESPPKTKDGVALPGATGWTWAVTVKFALAAAPGTDSLTETGLKRMTVTVTDTRGRKTILTALRAKTGSLEQRLVSANSCLSWLSADLQVGNSSNTRLTSATPLLNTPGP